MKSPGSAEAFLLKQLLEIKYVAGVAQLVELQPSKLTVAGSSPVSRSD